jgi:signal transduction histidine kinase
MSKSMMQDQEFQFFIEREKQTTNAIRQMISFTRDYQDIGLYRPQWQNLDTIVHLLAKTLDFHGVVLIINLRYLEIFADPLLEKVVYTLIENALRHGRSLTSIKFSYKITDAGCIILCDDNGIGIKTAEKEKIFEQGFGKHTGFGLFLAREILGITGFTIKETGIFGKGARFEIFVPEGAFQVNTKPALTDGGSTGT